MPKQFFKNKVALITGSSSGIGKATAALLGKQGAKLVINGRNPEKLAAAETWLKSQGVEVRAIAADVSEVAAVTEMIEKAVHAYGRIDILINNAGMSSRGYFETLAPQVFDDMMRINFLGCLYPTKIALPYLQQSRGSVVFISSVAGIRGLPETSLYCASKMALTSIAESLKVEFYEMGIHVGIVYVGITQNDPGKQVIAADGSRIILESRQERSAQTPEQVAQAIVRNIRRRRFKTILTPLGKLNALANVLFPRLVDKLLIRAKDRINKMNQ